MKVLMINKFLHPNGGSETYIFKLGKYLQSQGHEVQYFGMDHEGRCVGNRVGAYTRDMDFHGGLKLSKLFYPVKTIYSVEARRKLRLVLDDFHPDVCHLNNFNYQLTPSVILEIVKWRKETGAKCRIVYTAHDYQLVCPNHMLHNPNTHQNCEKCLGGRYGNCLKGRCIHGSILRSWIGMLEACYWKRRKVYRHLDAVICCSAFMKAKLDSSSLLKTKTVVLHNFISLENRHLSLKKEEEKKGYVLYFGRFSKEKGVVSLLEACRGLPDIPFVFAGAGPLEKEVCKIRNIQNKGFLSGDALELIIKGAEFSVCPSEWYENCPFSVMESLAYGTPVLGADIGGIPELVCHGRTGELFESGNVSGLREKIRRMWADKGLVALYRDNCKEIVFDTLGVYCEKLVGIYEGTVKEWVKEN